MSELGELLRQTRLLGNHQETETLIRKHLDSVGTEPDAVAEFLVNRIMMEDYTEVLATLTRLKSQPDYLAAIPSCVIDYLSERFTDEPIVHELMVSAAKNAPNSPQPLSEDHPLLTELPLHVSAIEPYFADECHYDVHLQCTERCQHQFSIRLQRTMATSLSLQCPKCLGHARLSFDEMHQYLHKTGRADFVESGPELMDKIEEFFAELLAEETHKEKTERLLEMQSAETAYYLMGFCMERYSGIQRDKR